MLARRLIISFPVLPAILLSIGCTQTAVPNASKQLQISLSAHGGLEDIETQGLTVNMDGEFDLTTRLQGRSPDRPEPTPIIEKIFISPSDEDVIYDLDWYNYYSSHQTSREVHLENRQVAFANPETGAGGYLPRETVSDHKERLTRVVPQLFLKDALAHEPEIIDGAVRYTSDMGQTLSLYINPDSQLLSAASATLELPVYGLSDIEWRWHYDGVEGDIVWPERYDIRVNQRTLKSSSYDAQLGLPESIDMEEQRISLGPPPALQPYEDFIPHAKRDPVVENIADGTYLVRGLRAGFTMMFVDTGDSIVAIDAPADWFEMNQIPPLDWSYGMEIDALGEKYLKAIKETVPGKPVSHLVLTHHHSDHIGGLMPFVRDGATLVGGPEVLDLVQTHFKEIGDEDIINIENDFRLEGATQTIRLLPLPDGNPKADGYLMVYVEEPKILYTSAFIYPIPEAAFPPPESVFLSKYFVDWLDGSSLDYNAIYNVHGNAVVEDWHLQTIRELD